MLNDVYGLNFSVKSFAVANQFVMDTNKVCYALGQQLTPFCIFGRDAQISNGVADFTAFQGVVDPSKTLLDEISSYRADVYRNSGMSIDFSSDIKKKLLFFDYLMTISMCYVEVPKYATKDGRAYHTYDKFLCTRNPAIMGAWMGMDSAEAQAKYSAKIGINLAEFDKGELRFVKLNNSAKGNSITVPRSSFSVEKMVCIPVYMLYAFTEGFKPVIAQETVKFSYLKDNNTVRELVTTLNPSILNDIYQDNMFVNTMLSGVDINTVKQGGMTFSSKLNRGYIKVPEVGSSIYDATGVRSLNLARLIKAERVAIEDIDLSCIKVDLDSAVPNFYVALDYALKTFPHELGNIYQSLTGEVCSETTPAGIIGKLYDFVEGRKIVLSTTFFRSLHNFMASNPLWFPLYTGTPAQNIMSSANFGVSTSFDF